jgi:gamma-glutamyl hercynylcysteine S-oxide synthase
LLKTALCIFEKEPARSLPFHVRLEAAEALGRAGDPRLAEDRDNWVRVEGGAFWMGAQSTDPNGRNYDRNEYGNEGPGRQVTVAPLFMARYLVTVAEYERFVTSGGYQKGALWSAGGFGQFTEPAKWADQLRYPNRPVTGVSWYEAAAYCASIHARLPSEEDWECAARGGREGVRYPWGPEAPDEHRANYAHEGGPGAPTPVGMYPEGATPSGIQDLAGNVWEWTNSGYEQGESRTVRGGGWDYDPEGLRVSLRFRDQPGYRTGYLGFRCVRG